jgi:hypothetical protein
MFRLSESDYRRLEPLAVKVYKSSAKSPHVARLMESKVGRRALVDMMFLEAPSTRGGVGVPLKDLKDVLNPDSTRGITKELVDKEKEELQKEANLNERWGSQTISNQTEGDILEQTYILHYKLSKDEKVAPEDKVGAFTRIKDKVKNFFAKISKWFKGKFDKPLKRIYSFFAEKGNKGLTIKWLHVAIVVAVVAILGYILFGTSVGEKIRTFIFNSIKAGINGVKSAVRYVLGKSGVPKQAVDETEDFLDEATA